VPYALQGAFRAPHIHVAVSKNGRRLLTTQCLIRGHEANSRDGVFKQVRDASARETVLVDFKPLRGSQTGELAANFDIVFGRTVHENEEGKMTGGIGKPEAGRSGPPRHRI
jgi:protocatechuate 3,4-dioxygenase beta subunit